MRTLSCSLIIDLQIKLFPRRYCGYNIEIYRKNDNFLHGSKKYLSLGNARSNPSFTDQSFVQMNLKMRIATFFVLLLTAGTVALGQNSEVRKVEAFKGIKASEAISVVLKKGDKESVRVEVE